MAPRRLLIADLFAGAGGTTAGAMRAIHALGRDVEFVAVNHWPVAIATHETNHPNVRHYCKDLDSANPNEIVPEGELDLLLASPECRFHSPAQGGRPLDEQNRASGWHVVRWAERLYVRRIVVENVPRFTQWGPLDRKGRPIQKRKGELFRAWIVALEAIGYRVEWRILNAADYGTPQTRTRLFVQARRDGRRIIWPERTHAPRGSERTLHGDLQTWAPARSAIRLEKYRHLAKPVQDKDLAPKTLARIADGVKRFCRGGAEPFIVELRRFKTASSLDEPLPVITTSGAHHALLEPFIIPQQGDRSARSVERPLPTIVAQGRSTAIVEPFLLVKRQHDETKSLDEPLPTITTSGRNHFVVEPYLVESNHGKKRRPRAVTEPLPAITGKNGVGVVEPVVDEQTRRIVLLHRMLQPEELGLGQDFDGYTFTGTREEQTKQIGNAVPVRLAHAMTAAALSDLKAVPMTSDDEDAAMTKTAVLNADAHGPKNLREHFYPGEKCDCCSATMKTCAACDETLCERCFDNHEC